MIRVFLGFAVLLTIYLLQLTHAIALAIDESGVTLRGGLFPLLKIGLAVCMSLVIVTSFFRLSKLSLRLPRPIPGANILAAGCVMALAGPVILTCLMHFDLRSGITSFIVQNGLTHFSTAVVLVFGCVRVLLSAKAALPAA